MSRSKAPRVRPDGVPVYYGPRILEYASGRRLEVLLAAPNTEAVIRRKDKRLVQVNVLGCGDDSGLPPREGNPQAYSCLVRQETEYEPRGVWALKHLPKETADLYDTVWAGCLKRVA